MRRLVRICYAAETRSEALRQLFTVLVKERKDILTDAMIGNPDNPLMGAAFHGRPRHVQAEGPIACKRRAPVPGIFDRRRPGCVRLQRRRIPSIVRRHAPADIEGKYFLSYEHIHLSVQALAARIVSSRLRSRPDRRDRHGRFHPRADTEDLHEKPILTVGISYYGPDNKPAARPRTIQWIDEVEKKLAGQEGSPGRRGGRFARHPRVLPARAALPQAGGNRRGRPAQQEEGEDGERSRPRSTVTSPVKSSTTSGSATPGTRGTSPPTRRSPAQASQRT